MRDIKRPRRSTLLQKFAGLNGDASDVRFLMRSGMDFDTAVTKVHEAKSCADSLLNKCLAPITAGG